MLLKSFYKLFSMTELAHRKFDLIKSCFLLTLKWEKSAFATFELVETSPYKVLDNVEDALQALECGYSQPKNLGTL